MTSSLKPPSASSLPVNDFATVVREAPINVQYPEYGARGDGSANDTAALVRALAAGPDIYVPPGTYMVDPDVLVRSTAGRLMGAGMGANGTLIKARSAGGAILQLSAQYDEVSGIRFHGNALANYGVVVQSCARAALERLYVTQTQSAGIYFKEDYGGLTNGNNNSMTLFKVVCTDNNGDGIRSFVDDDNTNAITFTAVTCTLNDSNGLYWCGDGLTLFGGHYEGNVGFGIKLGDVAGAGFCIDAGLMKPWVEGNTAGGVSFTKASRCSYYKISACQAAIWQTDGILNVQIEEGNVGSNGTLKIATGADGRHVELSNDRVTLGGGTDTNRILYLSPKGNGGVGIGAASGLTPILTSGTGSPEGVIGAVVGSFYMRKDGGAGTSLYVKESGSGGTGWVAK